MPGLLHSDQDSPGLQGGRIGQGVISIEAVDVELRRLTRGGAWDKLVGDTSKGDFGVLGFRGKTKMGVLLLLGVKLQLDNFEEVMWTWVGVPGGRRGVLVGGKEI
jgi:hypothetical protein